MPRTSVSAGKDFSSLPLTNDIDFRKLVHDHPDLTYASRTRNEELRLVNNLYWKRLWIVQEMFPPSAFKVFIFDGISKQEIVVLSDFFAAILDKKEEEEKEEEEEEKEEDD
jgi:hypothetical protein